MGQLRSDVVLESRPRPWGALRPNLYGLDLEGPGLALRAALTIFRHQRQTWEINNSYNNEYLIDYY